MKKNSKYILTIVAVIIALGVLFVPIMNTTSQFSMQKDDTITIGSIGILTGEGSSWGNASKNGITMAAEEINANGGINGKKLVIDYQDDKGDAKEALSAFEYLTSRGIDIIVGTSWSNTGLPLIQVADSRKVLMISPSLGKPEFNESSKYLFNLWPHDVTSSRQLADYVYSKGHRTVSIIACEQLWVNDQTKAFKERFEELGGTIEVLVEPIPEQTTVLAEATKLKNAKNSTALVSTTDGILIGAKMAKAVRELGVTLPIYSVIIDSQVVNAGQGAYEGTEFLTYLTPTKSFKEKYEARFGQIEIGADTAYDAVMLIAQAIEKTKSTDTDKLQEYLNNLKTYSGASGELTFDGKGGTIKDSAVMKVKDSKIVQLE